MKRILSLLVALIMMLGLVGTAVAEEFTYPMDGTVAISINFGGENLDNNAKSAEEAFANPEKYLFNAIGVVSEAAGVYVYSNGASWDSGSEEFQYMLLGGELPDILVNNFNKTYTGGAAAAIEAGYIIDLNPYTDWMPNYMAYLDENPDVRMQVTTDDGKLWGCAGVEDTYYMYKDRGIVLRKDILDALDLEVPTTFDEFEAVLYAVKEAYPDMIPFSSEMRWMYLQHMFSSLSNAYNCSYPFYCVDGENVEFAMYSEGYKTFLQRIATWYEDGLIDPDFASINKGGVRGKLANGEVFAANQQASNSATSVKSCTIEGAEFVAIPALVLNEGDPVRNYSLSGMKMINNYTFSVSGDCPEEKLEAVIRYLDFCYSQKGQELLSYGKEGVSFTKDENGNIIFPEVHVLDSSGKNELCKRTMWAGEIIGGEYFVDEYQKPFLDVYVNYDENAGVDLPRNDVEAAVYGQYFSDLDSYCQEKIVGLVLGTESFDNWDTIVDTCRNAYHADEVLAVLQSSYTRNMANVK